MMDGKLKLFKHVLRFMQENDRNGDWLGAGMDEAKYVRSVLVSWIDEHALDVTPRVQRYLNLLDELI